MTPDGHPHSRPQGQPHQWASHSPHVAHMCGFPSLCPWRFYPPGGQRPAFPSYGLSRIVFPAPRAQLPGLSPAGRWEMCHYHGHLPACPAPSLQDSESGPAHPYSSTIRTLSRWGHTQQPRACISLSNSKTFWEHRVCTRPRAGHKHRPPDH